MDLKVLHDKYLAALEEAKTAHALADEADAAARAAHDAYLAAQREADAATAGAAPLVVDESDDIEAVKGQYGNEHAGQYKKAKGQFE